ncbi:MAG: FtsX-like permease family protein [Thermoanaerobaculia bacterium]
MTRHLLRLVWNRKRSTALLLLELFVTFLVVALVTTTAIYQATNWRRPLGFTVDNMLVAELNSQRSSDDTFDPHDMELFARLLQEAKALPEVESVAGSHVVPFSLALMESSFDHGGRHIDSSFNEVTDDFARTAGIEMAAGRWFGREDDGAAVTPLVVDGDFARNVFGSDSAAVGQFLDDNEASDPKAARRQVVGVVAEYRAGGEFAGPENFFFERVRIGDTKHRSPRHLLIRVHPGTGIAFEERLAKRLGEVAPGWSIEVRPLAEYRADNRRLRAAPLIAGGIVGSFLLAMVALGLIGVVWQNVTERRREIGLRRALGATAAAVHRQFVAEMLLLATVALVAGTFVALQLPLLHLLGGIPLSVVLGGIAAANVALLLLAGFAAWLPSRMASRVTPTAALRWE